MTDPRPDASDPPACSAGATQCFGTAYQTCTGGAWTTTEDCPVRCDANLGCVECAPGTDYCDGNDVHSCNADGTPGGLKMACEGGLQCSAGTCTDLCTEAAASRSYIGCEYFSVDLDNAIEILNVPDPQTGCGAGGSTIPLPPGARLRTDLQVCHDPDATGNPPRYTAGLCDVGGVCPGGYTCENVDVCVLDAAGSPFAIVVSNPQTFAVDVTISDAAGTTSTQTVGAGAVTSLFPHDLGFADQSVDGSGTSAAAYRIVSTAPVVAYQFNPLDNVDVFSNDGSLLIPVPTWDTAYYAMSWPTLSRRPGTNDYNGYIAVVAGEGGAEVRVTPSANVRAGASQAAIAAGVATTFVLAPYDVLHLESAGGTADLTGTRVEAVNGTDVFGVFSGHEAITIPIPHPEPLNPFATPICCADHVEEMMFPTSTWGTAFALARSQSRGQNENDVVRILAQTAGTTVSFSPAPAMGSCGTLGPGQFCEVQIAADTEINANADHPILVGHYLMSTIWTNQLLGISYGSGDPSLSLAVPTEQFRTSYAFLVPNQYDEQFVSIVARTGTSVTLDGANVTGLATFGSGTFSAARVKVQPGQHTVECQEKCGIEVYGYSDAVSYLFAGGLNLEQIVID